MFTSKNRILSIALMAVMQGTINAMHMGGQQQIYTRPGHGRVLPKTQNQLNRLGRRYGKKQEPTGKQLAKRVKRARDYNRCCIHYYFHEYYHLRSVY